MRQSSLCRAKPDDGLHQISRRAASAFLAAGLLALAVTATAGAAVTYRSASGTCQDATLYANYSKSGGPKGKIASVAKGEVVGYQYTDGSWAVVRTGGDKIGFILRDCITVPQAGTSGSYLWPAKISCQDATLYASYNFATKHPGKKIGVVTRGQKVGYQYYNGNLSTGAYTAIQKGTKNIQLFGYVLRDCVNVADWAPKANWNPAR